MNTTRPIDCLLAGLSFLVFLPASAQTLAITRAAPSCAITFAGTFGSQSQDKAAGIAVEVPPDTMVNADLYVKKATTEIDLKIGQLFGVLRVFSGLPSDAKVQLVISHPAMTSPAGGQSTRSVSAIDLNQRGEMYRFDQPYAMVAGSWSMEYRFNGTTLCKQNFALR